MRCRLHAVVVVVVATVALALCVVPAHGQLAERIPKYDIDLTVEPDGGLLVKETIVYDFGSAQRHGIFRVIPVRENYVAKENYDRVWPIDVLSVSASAGTPAQYEVEEEGNDLRIRIGDPDTTITGTHTYEITYRVRGAFNAFADHDELVWDVIGNEWPVTIESATATVHVPASRSGTEPAITDVNCTSGPYGSNLPCGSSSFTGGTATFTQQPQFGIFPYQSMTVTVGMPKGTVPEPVPVLEERFNLSSSFRATAATTSISGGLLVVLIGAVGALLFFVGRDRRYRGSAVDAAFAPSSSDAGEGGAGSTPEERVPLRGEDETPVEFVPPDGLRPGQVGTLVDFKANPLDVTATIIDLAVRGYLVIEETKEPGLFRTGDWTLTETDAGATAQQQSGTDAELLQYERTLLQGLFRDGREVQLSDLHNTFATRMSKVQNALMNDAMRRKWFAGKPGTARGLWILAGILLIGAGIGLTVLLAALTHAALIGLPVIVAGVVLLVGAHWMPKRTAKGYAALRRAEGFRRFIDESEKERARFAERANLFSEYLPYAVVFGATKKWANTFAGLDDVPPDTSSWYRGHSVFTYAAFSGAIDSFSVSSAGTLTSSPSSSSSGSSGFSGGGFSGGGGGGGGGGSW